MCLFAVFFLQTNIEFQGNGSDYLWIHWAFVYFYTAIVFWRLWAFLQRMVALRTRYLRRLRRQTIEDAAAVVVGTWGARGPDSEAAMADAAVDSPTGGRSDFAAFRTLSRSLSNTAIPLQLDAPEDRVVLLKDLQSIKPDVIRTVGLGRGGKEGGTGGGGLANAVGEPLQPLQLLQLAGCGAAPRGKEWGSEGRVGHA